MSKEIRTINIKYGLKTVNIGVSLGDNVTIQIGDWYFEGVVKRASDQNNFLNSKEYQEKAGIKITDRND